tara:strand:- start:47 stop:892 length:846 start_codon:yes stop_codon:yes gene_type:complete
MSNKLKITVIGAAGKMGCELIRQISSSSNFDLIAAVEGKDSKFIGKDAHELAGCSKKGIKISNDLINAAKHSEAFIDFSSIESTLHASEISAQARIVHVIGTTGFSIEQEEIIKAAARHATVIKSGNMSLGINILLGVVQNITKLVDDNWAIEISEIHHKEKKDHPSGTALALGASVAKGKKIDLEENKVIDDPIIDAVDINLTKIRKNVVRKKDDIGFSSYRKDGVIGDHSVIFSSENERIALTHIAKNRNIFANGALKAALWGQNKKPGLYSMQDVLGF